MKIGSTSPRKARHPYNKQAPIDFPPDLEWVSDKEREDNLRIMHEKVTEKAHDLIHYYDKKIPDRSKKARRVRTIQLVMSVVVGVGLLVSAVLIPLYPRLYVIGVATGALLVIAVALTPFDGVFGLSGCWMRFMLARQSVLSLVDSFESEWQLHLCKAQGKPSEISWDEAAEAIEALQKFTKNMDNIVTIETRQWIREFSRTLNNIDRQLASYKKEVNSILGI